MLLLKPSRGASASRAEAYDFAPYEAPARPIRSAPVQRRAPGGSGSSGAGKPVFLFALILGLCGGLFYFSSREDYLLGQIAAVVLGPLSIHGLWRGGLRKTIMLAVIAGIAIYNSQLREWVGTGLGKVGITSDSATGILTLLAAFLIWLAAFFVGRAFRRRVIERRRKLLTVDRFAGMSIGVAEGVALLLCLCWAATSLEPYGRSLADGRIATNGSSGRKIGETIVRLSKESRVRYLGNLVVQTNPIDKIPAMQKAVHDLNTVGRISADQLDPKSLESLRLLLEKIPGGTPGDLGAALQSLSGNNPTRKLR